MSRFIALVRAANVGGTGRLPMATLTGLCVEAGFLSVETYINSGNVVFTSRLRESGVRRALEARLASYAGRHVHVAVRTAEQMSAVLTANPFPEAAPSRTVAIFLNEAPAADTLARAAGRTTERVLLGVREIYVDYGARMADSRLRFPGLEPGTARNLNTVAKLASLSRDPPA